MRLRKNEISEAWLSTLDLAVHTGPCKAATPMQRGPGNVVKEQSLLRILLLNVSHGANRAAWSDTSGAWFISDEVVER